MARGSVYFAVTSLMPARAPSFAAAQLAKILAKFSMFLTGVFIVFASIPPTKIYFSSTPTLYEKVQR
jgi:hypothetical protein